MIAIVIAFAAGCLVTGSLFAVLARRDERRRLEAVASLRSALGTWAVQYRETRHGGRSLRRDAELHAAIERAN